MASLFVLVVVYAVALSRHIPRSMVVDVETGALDVTLEAELSGKAFTNVWTCSKREGAAADELEAPSQVPPVPVGCRARTHVLSDGPLQFDTPRIPVGSRLKITSIPGMLRINVVSVPPEYSGTDDARLEGGGLILLDDALSAFGSLQLTGKLDLGAASVETDRPSTVSGRYQIRGRTPVGLIDGDMRVLRQGDLLAGARVRFVSDGQTASGHIVIMVPNPATSLMRVTAISEMGQSKLGVRYYFTDEVIIGPQFVEALILDPAVQFLLALFGAIAGYGWLQRIFSSGQKHPS
ncbi:MAG: hypothetical protein AB8B71_12340 [Paracoccaceae bacterium]